MGNKRGDKCAITEVVDSDDGHYILELKSIVPNDSVSCYELEIFLNGEEMLYSPFAIDGPASNCSALASLRADGGEVSSKPIETTAPASGRMPEAEKERLLDVTRLRAIERLKKEQKRLREEKNERARQRAVKRTGGGFIIQYSKDM